MKKTETNHKTSYTAFLFLALSLLIVARGLPLLKGSIGSYGYDYGFYLYAASHFNPLASGTWLTALWGGYSNPLFYLAKLLRFPPQLIINELYLFFTILLPLSFFWLFGKNRTAGILAIVLCATSLIQTESYTMFLWKSWAALPFLLLAFKFYQGKNWRGLFCSALLVALTHRTTFIVLSLSLGLTFIWELAAQKKYRQLILFLLTTAGIIGLAGCSRQLQTMLESFLHSHNASQRDGLFLDNQNFFGLLWPYLILALPGAVLYVKKHHLTVVSMFTLLCCGWFIFRLPFYRRFLIYIDLGLIFYSAYFLSQTAFLSTAKKIALAGIVCFLIWQSYGYAAAKQPLISQTEIQEIQNFNHPGAFILTTSADDAPWLLAFSTNARLGAPGLLEDPHTFQDWQQFWAGQNQIAFISKYPRPLYFYQRSYQLPGEINRCLAPISENFYSYDFACLESAK